jgi:hypothetical protein
MNAVILDDTTTGRSILYSNVDDRVCSGVTIFDPDIQRENGFFVEDNSSIVYRQ